MLHSLQDITIIPAVLSTIESRMECNPYVVDCYKKLPGTYAALPLFAAPMSCVIDDKNWETFTYSGINTIIPRNISIERRLELSIDTFVAVSLDEFKTYFIDVSEEEFEIWSKDRKYICIDIANGHMKKLLDYCEIAKNKWGDNLVIMTGNIANPDTYLEYAKVGIDYVRVGIGSGNVCTTSANGGIHYPMASLLHQIAMRKSNIIGPNQLSPMYYKSIPKIVADGGFNNYDQIIKALAIGADFVMSGKIFAKCEEACGQIVSTVDDSRRREYYGMSTKKAQKEFGKDNCKTAEGIITSVSIDYTVEGWVDNFKHYMRSAMSYTNSRTLSEFHKCEIEVMSPSAYQSYFK